MLRRALVFLFSLACFTGCKSDPLAKMPEFDILLADSATVLNTKDIPEGKPVIMMNYEADCSHCLEATEAMLNHIDALKGARLCFVTIQGFSHVTRLVKRFKMVGHENIIVGQDTTAALPKRYGTYETPFVLVFDARKQLRRAYKGGPDINNLRQLLSEIQ